MICKVCGYEISENFSICPCCGEKKSSLTNETRNSSPSSQLMDDNSQYQAINFNNTVFINRYINERIDIKDVKIPFGVNRDLIDKKNSTLYKFIMNEPIGGDFFPNKILPIIMILGIALFVPYMLLPNMLMSFLHLNNVLLLTNAGISIILNVIIYFIAMYLVVKLVSIKTKIIFSSNGIEAKSRKGKLFIPREDIEDVFVRETQGIETSHGEGDVTHHFPYIQYDMIVKFKRPVHFSSDNKDKNEIKLLKEYNLKSYLKTWNSKKPELFYIKTTKNLTYYIVQQIRKVFGIQ